MNPVGVDGKAMKAIYTYNYYTPGRCDIERR